MKMRDPIPASPESELTEGREDSLLLQLRSDRRLGHEWDDWDGKPLPDQGAFHGPTSLFFASAAALALAIALVAAVVIWVIAPRLTVAVPSLPAILMGLVGALTLGWFVWLGAVGLIVWRGTNWLPPRLAERGLLPWFMPRLERAAGWVGISRDVIGNSMLRVFDKLAIARARTGIAPTDLLILLPRCLGKEAMRRAMDVSSRYDVPMFVAARGRYARQMISMRRPKAVVAVACERDLVSGISEVAGRLPVLGNTLTLPEGPCKGTELDIGKLEAQVRTLLGLSPLETA